MKRIVLALVPLAFAAGVAACASEEPAAPSRPPIPPPVTTPEGGAPEGGLGEGGCFDTTKEKPTQPVHFLEQCNGNGCFPFDNGTRIEGWKAGDPLPPLN